MSMLRSVLLAGLALAGATSAVAQDYRDAPPYYDAARAGYDDPRGTPFGRNIRSVGDFEAPLARYGRWVPSRFGRAWAPNVGRDWRPYTIGRWEQTEQYGWLWQSDEPFGWATYHYGRWGFDDRFGWVWLPDTVWGPAWVAWRDGDDYAGWAPLPPQVSLSVGFGAWDYNRWYAPSWVYVPRGALNQRRLYNAILPYRDNHRYWDRTRGSVRRDARGGDFGHRGYGPGGSPGSGQGGAVGARPWDRRDDVRRDDARRDDARRSEVGRDDRRPDDTRRVGLQPDARQPGWQRRGDGGDDRQGYRRGDGERRNDATPRAPLDPYAPVAVVPPAVVAPPVDRGGEGRGNRAREDRPGGFERRGAEDGAASMRGGRGGGATAAPSDPSPRAAQPMTAAPQPQAAPVAPPPPRAERPAPSERPAQAPRGERSDRSEGPVRDQ